MSAASSATESAPPSPRPTGTDAHPEGVSHPSGTGSGSPLRLTVPSDASAARQRIHAQRAAGGGAASTGQASSSARAITSDGSAAAGGGGGGGAKAKPLLSLKLLSSKMLSDTLGAILLKKNQLCVCRAERDLEDGGRPKVCSSARPCALLLLLLTTPLCSPARPSGHHLPHVAAGLHRRPRAAQGADVHRRRARRR